MYVIARTSGKKTFVCSASITIDMIDQCINNFCNLTQSMDIMRTFLATILYLLICIDNESLIQGVV